MKILVIMRSTSRKLLIEKDNEKKDEEKSEKKDKEDK